MSWGLPPKCKVIHQFENVSFSTINDSVINALMNTNFEIRENSGYSITGVKKKRMTLMSFFALSRPRIDLVILLTKTGRLTINSTYDYNSSTGIAFNDRGQQKKEIALLLEEIIYIVERNDEFEKHGTIDGEKIEFN